MYIGAIIRQRRKELNLSQIDLSNEICVSSHLSKIENGKYYWQFIHANWT